MMDIEGLYRKHGPMVLRRCRSMLKDEEKALDAMQECFVRLLRGSERLSAAAPSSLLWRVATNVCLNQLRSERSRPAGGDEGLETLASVEDVEGQVLAGQLVEDIFRNERESTRAIAWMHYVDGMTLEETARASGLSLSGVRKRLAGLKARNSSGGEDAS
jgi:RNA polymerase sigma-70 factor (ECF subfamily)